ncbi:MAG: replicative DNA helicase [Rickettsiaceae bacterium]
MKQEVKEQQNPTLHRILPYNIQAEQTLLGAILINIELFYQVHEVLIPDHFFDVLHQKIFNSIIKILDKDMTPTSLTVSMMLNQEPSFINAGGREYLNKLTTMSMMVISVNDYCKLVYDLALKRYLINLGENIVNNAYDVSLEKDAMEQIEYAETSLYNLATTGKTQSGFIALSETLSDSLLSIDRIIKHPKHVTGISTGFYDLDQKLSGFHNSDLIIIAARPSMGKTAFAINLAINACYALQERDEKKEGAVGFFSLEMSSEELAYRILSMEANIPGTKLRSGKIIESEYNLLSQSSDKLSKLNLFIDDTPALSISALRSRARKLKRKHNLSILFIDYLQLIRASGRHDNRNLEITEITQSLKAIAKELKIPVIVLSQLSRAVEARSDKRPMLSDLRESGSIEQDSDIVMFLYREEYYVVRSEPEGGSDKHNNWQTNIDDVHNKADIIVAKHRNGPVGSVTLFYDTMHSKFGNVSNLKKGDDDRLESLSQENKMAE